MTLRVGLTGGLASGKTTVAQMFSARGVHVMFADEVARELMQPGQTVYDEVVEHFGDSIVNPDKTINRARLAEIAFGSNRIEELNRIVHPGVRTRMEQWIEETSEFDPCGILMYEAALILEAGVGKYFDKLIVVTSSPQQKVERFTTRALRGKEIGEAERAKALHDAERRMGAQLSEEEKIQAADYVIDNSGTLPETERQVNRVFKELQHLASQKRHASGCSR